MYVALGTPNLRKLYNKVVIIGVGDGGQEGQLPHKFGQKVFFGQKSCKIQAFC